MASVSFDDQSRGRSGRVPLSFYNPVMVTDDKPLFKVMPHNAVPTGKGTKGQQIGYWNMQPRWRMVKGQRKDLTPKWHFYYLGTGPHADAPFRQKLDGVFWVAVQGSDTQPTGLGVRKRNQPLIKPQFAVKLPANIEIQEEGASKPNSRNPSTNRDRSQSGNRSASRGPQQGNTQNQNQNNNSSKGNQNNNQQRSRNNSKSRSQNNSQPQNQQVDIVAAVKQALKELGVSPQEKKQKQKGNTSGNNTPKEQRAKSPARSPSSPRKQLERPVWKRVPTEAENVTQCFGPRDTLRNFGDRELTLKGVEAKNYPQIAEFVPTPAALLFGGEVSTREAGEDVEITFHYKMKVKKDDKNLPLFLQQVSAYALPSQAPNVPSQLNPVAPDFTPSGVEIVNETVEMIDQVYDSFEA
uniref:Nucleoprotein n=1 Tax=Bat Coronavirus RsYN20 TaxID=3018909 RepID=A0AA49ECM4_9NIDO|nr:nucleocapsid phosphoprotein [Bat Coronavirus RsYN20]